MDINNDEDKESNVNYIIVALLIWSILYLVYFFSGDKKRMKYVIVGNDGFNKTVIGAVSDAKHARVVQKFIQRITDELVEIVIVPDFPIDFPAYKGVKLYKLSINLDGQYFLKLAKADKMLLSHTIDANLNAWTINKGTAISYIWGANKEDVIKKIPKLYMTYFNSTTKVTEFIEMGDN
jgi:hypothetical protein